MNAQFKLNVHDKLRTFITVRLVTALSKNCTYSYKFSIHFDFLQTTQFINHFGPFGKIFSKVLESGNWIIHWNWKIGKFRNRTKYS